MPKPWYSGPWPKIRRLILERDNFECQIKGPHCIGRANQVDHIRPVRNGGMWWEPANLRAACNVCNGPWNRGKTYHPSRDW